MDKWNFIEQELPPENKLIMLDGGHRNIDHFVCGDTNPIEVLLAAAPCVAVMTKNCHGEPEYSIGFYDTGCGSIAYYNPTHWKLLDV